MSADGPNQAHALASVEQLGFDFEAAGAVQAARDTARSTGAAEGRQALLRSAPISTGGDSQPELDRAAPERGIRSYTPEEAAQIAKQARTAADRRQGLADKRAGDAAAAFNQARAAVAGIPFGQPILAGRHSAKRHRAALRRSDRAAARGVDAADKRDYHQGKADRALAWAAEVERRARGSRYEKSDLQPGDRIGTTNNPNQADAVVVRSNAKSVTAWPAYGAPFDTDELAPIFVQMRDNNPLRTDWLKIRNAWRQIDGAWVEIQGANDTAQLDDAGDEGRGDDTPTLTTNQVLKRSFDTRQAEWEARGYGPTGFPGNRYTAIPYQPTWVSADEATVVSYASKWTHSLTVEERESFGDPVAMIESDQLAHTPERHTWSTIDVDGHTLFTFGGNFTDYSGAFQIFTSDGQLWARLTGHTISQQPWIVEYDSAHYAAFPAEAEAREYAAKMDKFKTQQNLNAPVEACPVFHVDQSAQNDTPTSDR